jgi:hypothetical protein
MEQKKNMLSFFKRFLFEDRKGSKSEFQKFVNNNTCGGLLITKSIHEKSPKFTECYFFISFLVNLKLKISSLTLLFHTTEHNTSPLHLCQKGYRTSSVALRQRWLSKEPGFETNH